MGLMDFMNSGDMFGGAGVYSDLLTEEQKKRMGQQSMMAMAAKLLQAGGPSTTRTGLGQALGGAYLTGQEAYEKAGAGAMNQMLTKQKIEEYRLQKARDADWQNRLKGMVSGGGAPAQDMTPVRQQGMPPIPGLMAPPPPQQPMQGGGMMGGLSLEQIALIAQMPRSEGQKAILDNLNERSKAANKWSQPFSVMQGDTPVLMRQNELGATEVLPGSTPYEASVSESRLLKEMGLPVSWENVIKLRQSSSAKTTVEVNTGQHGFSNVMDLSSKFKSEPIYKDLQDMKSAYSQISSALRQGTPISDTAAATKIMKLLDPGSVVRESELGMAMAAGGRMDRLQNYLKMYMTGEKLTPTQRTEFQSLADELYSAAGSLYNQKRTEFQALGDAFKLQNVETALGNPFTPPSQPARKKLVLNPQTGKFEFK